MKKHLSKLALLFVGSIVFLSVYACSEDSITSPDSISNNSQMSEEMDKIINEIAISELTEIEAHELLFMREEEKLARDVYKYLYSKWNQRTFTNISNSENQHMSSLLLLIKKYELVDPVGTNAVGVFSNSDLQSLYNSLISAGAVSLVDGLKVGAAIEEIDIIDLDKAIANTDNEEFIIVYQNLRKGSENHLRAFVNTLYKNGTTYSPQYLSVEEYSRIIGN